MGETKKNNDPKYDLDRLTEVLKREQDKKIMLFIDGEVPKYDKSGGAFIVFEYLKIFVKQGYKIIFWPYNRECGEPYAGELRKMGVEVICGDNSFKEFIEKFGKNIDVSIICRLQIATDYFDLVRKNTGGEVIFNTIDLHHLRESRYANLSKDKEDKKRAQKTREEEVGIMEKADLTLVFSGEEYKILKKKLPEVNVEVIPWIQELNVEKGASYNEGRENILFLGGFMHPPNVDGVKWFHDFIFPIVKKEIPGLRVTIIGSHVPEEIKELESKDFEVLGFVEDLSPYFNKARVFIAPLRYGAGIKGKIATALSYGLPVVTTSVGAEGMGIRDGQSALITDKPKEFADKLIKIYKDEGLWNKLSKNSIEHVKESYSLEVAERKIEKTMEKAKREHLMKKLSFDFTGERLVPDHTKNDLVFYEHFSRYIFASQFVEGKTVLDIACGVGYGTEFMAKKGAKKVIGVDVDIETIEYAKQRYKGDNTEFIVADAHKIPLADNSIDVVVSFETIEHLKDYKKFLSEVARVLREEGVLIISTPNKEVFVGNKYHTKEFTIGEFSSILENNFKKVDLYYQNNLLGSAVSRRSLIKQDDLEKDYKIKAYKSGSQEPSESLYSLAVCGNAELPVGQEGILLDSGKELEKLYKIIRNVMKEQGTLREQGEKLKEKLNKKEEELKVGKILLKQKERELNGKADEILMIHSSTSWRATWPMRAIKNTLKKIARLARKSRDVIKAEGFYKFLRLAGKFLYNRFSGRMSLGRAAYSHNYSDIKHWYSGNKKKVSIVIPSYNDYKVLKKCLTSINKTVDERWADIIIVDDASPKEAHAEFLKSIDQKNVKIIYQETNGGFAKTVNAGLRAVKSGDVIVLNSDTEAKEYWLESLQSAAYSNKSIGIVGPKLLYPNGTIQFAGAHRNTGAPEWFDHYYRFKPSNYAQANIPNYVLGITGACMYIKSEVIKQIGLLDEKFPMAFEDMDYCIRAWNKGYRSLYFPMATLIHHESVARGRELGAAEKESLRYFWEKWGDWFDKRNVLNEKGQVRIIYVLQATSVGGGHRMVFEHLNRLKDLGFAVELYALEGQPNWFPLRIKVKTFKDYQHLIAGLENEEAIKVATWWETAEPVWLSSVNKGIPVYYVQDIESSYYRDDNFMQQFVVSKYRKEFKYLTISGWNRGQLLEMGVDPLVIGCGIDSKTFKLTKDKREGNVLMAVGRSHYLKNLQMTIDAWKGIKKDQPTLWMFGIEPELVEGSKNAKYFLKPTDEEINVLLNKATVFAQTSRHEGFCLPVVEAMAAGAAVITTDSHGNADFCVDDKNCLMVEQDDVEGLQKAIKKLFTDKKLRERLIKEGYKTAKEYDWPAVTNKIEKFYKELGKAK